MSSYFETATGIDWNSFALLFLYFGSKSEISAEKPVLLFGKTQ